MSRGPQWREFGSLFPGSVLAEAAFLGSRSSRHASQPPLPGSWGLLPLLAILVGDGLPTLDNSRVSLSGVSPYPCSPHCVLFLGMVFKSLSHVQLFVTPWTAARQASPSVTVSRSLLKRMSVESLLPPSPLAFDLSQHQGLFQ